MKLRFVAVGLLTALSALAGPPLICEPGNIGTAQSLPWKAGQGWQGVDPAYNVAKLTDDTLALLAPGTPLPVRMETMRRAAIYGAKDVSLVRELTARLMARALDAAATAKPASVAWFDAGYFVETVRQAGFMYDILPTKDQTSWKLRRDASMPDGYAWVQRAIQLGGKDMGRVLPLMAEFRDWDLKAAHGTLQAAK